jgi:hypothetical protein
MSSNIVIGGIAILLRMKGPRDEISVRRLAAQAEVLGNSHQSLYIQLCINEFSVANFSANFTSPVHLVLLQISLYHSNNFVLKGCVFVMRVGEIAKIDC